MQIYQLIRKDLKRFAADKRALIINISLPLILTTIMGLSFGGGMFGSSQGISAIPVALVGEDLPEMLRSQLAQGLTESGFFTVTWTDSLRADTLVREGEVSAAVVFPEKLIEKFFTAEAVPVEIWKDPGSQLKAGIVEQILKRSLAQYQAGEAVYLTLWPENEVQFGKTEEEFWSSGAFEGSFFEIWQRFRSGAEDSTLFEARERILTQIDRQTALNQAFEVSNITLAVSDRSPTGGFERQDEFNLFNFFLPGLSVFFLMFSVAANCREMHREKHAGTLQRQLLSPIRRSDLLIGRWLSGTLQGAFMLGVLYLVGGIVFRVNLGPDPLSLLVAVLVCSAAATSIFLFFTLVSANEKIMDNVTTVVILFWAMVGGSFIPISQMPPWVVGVGRFSFTYWANTSFQNIMTENRGLGEAPLAVLVLALVAVVMLLLNVLLFQLRDRKGDLA
jgi:ABC-2 type transport system permease protein